VTQILLVGLGGCLGSIARYLGSGAVQRLSGDETFPVGTVAVNLSGCFAIGVLSYAFEFTGLFSPATRSFLIIGFLGGFTTFSAFGNETFQLLRTGDPLPAVANVLVQVSGGLLLVWAGRGLGYLIWR
jgi:CrcB protein